MLQIVTVAYIFCVTDSCVYVCNKHMVECMPIKWLCIPYGVIALPKLILKVYLCCMFNNLVGAISGQLVLQIYYRWLICTDTVQC